ncbi:MAG: DegT/DnrJ/EryC1/StrS family aminotransferase, partial [Bacillota bacterium]
EIKYYHTMVGYNYRMTEVAAAIGREQVRLIDEFSRVRRKNAKFLTDSISHLGLTGFIPPYTMPHATHVFHQYTVLVDEEKAGRTRDEIASALKSAGVETGVHYPRPIYDQPCYLDDLETPPDCPVTEHIYRRVLSLPVHPGLSEEDLEHVAHALAKSCSS